MTVRSILCRHSSGKKVLVLFVLTNLVYTFMLTVTIPEVMGYAEGSRLLDLMPMGYGFDYVMQLFNTLGEKGRAAYLFYQLPVDMIYPVLFALTYTLLLAYVLKRMDQLKGFLIYACLLPFLAAAGDYGENMGIIYLLKAYPIISVKTVAITNLCTIVKSMATTFYFGFLLFALMWWGAKTLFYRIRFR